MTPVVDIGIPTRNTLAGERLEFLRTAIDSIHAQTFGDWRLVVSRTVRSPARRWPS